MTMALGPGLGLMAQLIGRWIVVFLLSLAMLWLASAYKTLVGSSDQIFDIKMVVEAFGRILSEIRQWPQAGPAGLFHQIVCGTHWLVYSTMFLSILAFYAVLMTVVRIALLVSCRQISHLGDWHPEVLESSRRFDMPHLWAKGSFRAYILHWLRSPSWEYLESLQSESIVRLSSIMMSVIAAYAIFIGYIKQVASNVPDGGFQYSLAIANSFLIMPASFKIIFADGAFLLCAARIYRRAQLRGYVQGHRDGNDGGGEVREGIWRTLCYALLFVAGMLAISVAVRLFCTVMLTGQPCRPIKGPDRIQSEIMRPAAMTAEAITRT